MTLIIGAKFNDGVILVSDRKVTQEGTGRYSYENKLKVPLNIPLVFGAAGYSHKFKQFNRKIQELVDRRVREINIQNVAYFKSLGLELPTIVKKMKPKKLDSKEIAEKPVKENKNELPEFAYVYSTEMFLEDCQNLIKNLCSIEGSSRPDLDVLLAISTNQARLHHINFLGEEEELDYYAIGSGADYVQVFLRKYWREDMTIEEILKLCYFCIYYVQDLDFDSGVGMEESLLPDHLVVTHGGGALGSWSELDSKSSLILKEIKDKIKEFKNIHESLKF